jgi:hypothetical protein
VGRRFESCRGRQFFKGLEKSCFPKTSQGSIREYYRPLPHPHRVITSPRNHLLVGVLDARGCATSTRNDADDGQLLLVDRRNRGRWSAFRGALASRCTGRARVLVAEGVPDQSVEVHAFMLGRWYRPALAYRSLHKLAGWTWEESALMPSVAEGEVQGSLRSLRKGWCGGPKQGVNA